MENNLIEKADKLEKEAIKKLDFSFFTLFKNSKMREASEKFRKAGNMYKMGNKIEKSIHCYQRSGSY